MSKDISKEAECAFVDALIDVGVDYDLYVTSGKDIREYVNDSMAFVALVVDLENRFNFNFSDDLLSHETVLSFEVLRDAVMKNTVYY